MFSHTAINTSFGGLKPVLYPALLLLALSAFAAAGANASEPEPRLKANVKVHSHLVTLADLFTNTGVKGATAVFRSPDPGTTGKVSVRRVLSAAKTHGLTSTHAPAFQMVTITRSSRVIEISEIKDLIRGQLEGKLPGIKNEGQLVIQLPEKLEKLHVDPGVQGELSLSSFDWSPRSGRFTARFSLAGSDPLVIKGSAGIMMKVGVAARDIARGALIARKDIEMKYIRIDGRRPPELASIEDLVGLSARRRLPAGRTINMRDLEQPRLIEKNQLVTILLEVPGLVLRTEGKALEDATSGQTLKVLNTQSKRIIHATAIASGLVRVAPGRSSRSGS